MKREAPTRPFTTFADFVAKVGFPFTRKSGVTWPCMECDGRGKVVDPQYYPSYQSHTEYVRCPTCKGTGEGKRKDCLTAYSRAISEWRHRLKEYRRLSKLRKSGLAKLTKEEKSALGLFDDG